MLISPREENEHLCIWCVVYLGAFPKCELCLHEQYYNLYCMYIQ